MTSKQQVVFSFRVFLIVLEVSLITFVSHLLKAHWEYENGRYISVDVFYCLPVIQTARLASLHVMRRSDTQVSTVIGIILALAWSLTEAALFWPFPLESLALNIFTRAVVFTVMGRVIGKLLREREYAHKDGLTGLANRAEFLRRLAIEQERSERTRSPYSVLFIDLDNFKALNDTLGHRTGDEALKTVASILRASTRKVDVAARVGGDEFLVLLPDTDAPSCDIVVGRIEAASGRAFQEQSWQIGLSTGRATWVGRTEEPEWVIHLADEDMYKIKNAKKVTEAVATSEA